MTNSTFTTPFTPALVRGAAELEPTARGVRPHRLPAAVRERYPDPQLLLVEAQPSGVRLAFRTAATRIRLVTHPSRVGYVGVDRPRGRLDVYVDDELRMRDALTAGDLVEVDLQTGTSAFVPGDDHVTVLEGLPSGVKDVEIWLPHNEAIELVSLQADAELHPAGELRAMGEVRAGATETATATATETATEAETEPARDPEAAHPPRPLWLHHGSSISHGSNAIAPSEIWPAIAARRGGVELRNLGLGGSALVDPFLAQVMRDAPADLISVKLGINVVNLDGMRVRTFVSAVHGFLDTIREGHPDTPLVLISPIFCGIHERTPGPGAIDPASIGTAQVRFIATGTPGDEAQGRLTLEVIRRELASLAERRADDPNLHYLDGLQLFGETDAVAHPLADALHPGPEAHALIGTRFADYAFAPTGPFAPVAVA